MGFYNIEKRSFGYRLLFVVTEFWHNTVFYKRVIVLNKENILKDANVMFTPNHQNALMDALALLFTIPRQLIFMARADIFAKTWVASILYFLKILPIYRQSKDGKDSIQKNEAIFKRTAEVLTSGNGLALLPEGSHEGVHKIRPLKKGFARIAFQTEEANNFSLDLKIVPIGIDYSNYQDFRSSLIVNYGTPISVSDYYSSFKESPNLAINNLKVDLETRMKKLIVDIESEKYYHLYDELKDIYNDKMCSTMQLPRAKHLSKFTADRKFISILRQYEKEKEEEMPVLQQLVTAFSKKRKSLGFSNQSIIRGNENFFVLIMKTLFFGLTFPLFLLGFLNNLLPWSITIWAGSKIKDPQFKSSFKFVVSLVAFALFYTIQSIVFGIFCTISVMVWAYIIFLPISAVLAWWWYDNVRKTIVQWKFYRLERSQNPDFQEMMRTHKEIIENTERIVSDYFNV